MPQTSCSETSLPLGRLWLAPARGLALACRRPELRWLFLRCAAALVPTTLVVSAVGGGVVWEGWRLTRVAVVGRTPAAAWAWTVWGIALSLVTATVAVQIVWTACFGLFASRAVCRLAEETEAALGLPRAEFVSPCSVRWWNDARHDLVRLPAMWLSMALFSLVPVVGQVFVPLLALGLCALFAGRWLFAAPITLREPSRAACYEFMDRQARACLPLGLSVLLGGAAPVVGALWTAGGVVAAVLLFREIDGQCGMVTARPLPQALPAGELERFQG